MGTLNIFCVCDAVDVWRGGITERKSWTAFSWVFHRSGFHSSFVSSQRCSANSQTVRKGADQTVGRCWKGSVVTYCLCYRPWLLSLSCKFLSQLKLSWLLQILMMLLLVLLIVVYCFINRGSVFKALPVTWMSQIWFPPTAVAKLLVALEGM